MENHEIKIGILKPYELGPKICITMGTRVRIEFVSVKYIKT